MYTLCSKYLVVILIIFLIFSPNHLEISDTDPDNTHTFSACIMFPETALWKTPDFHSVQQSRGDLLAGRPLIRVGTIANNNNVLSHMKNTTDLPTFYCSISQNWAGGASSNRVTLQRITQMTRLHSLAIFPEVAGSAKAFCPHGQKNLWHCVALCAGEMRHR